MPKSGAFGEAMSRLSKLGVEDRDEPRPMLGRHSYDLPASQLLKLPRSPFAAAHRPRCAGR